MKKFSIVLCFIFGFAVLGLGRFFCYADQQDQNRIVTEPSLNQEEIDIVAQLPLLENLEYLEDEEGEFLSHYDTFEDETDEKKIN